MKGEPIGRIEALPRNWQKKAERIHGITTRDLGGLESGVYDFSCIRSERLILAVVIGRKIFRITDQRVAHSLFGRCIAA